MNFANFNFKPFISETLDAIGFAAPTQTQTRLLPPILAGRDLVGEAQTGSGKTHAFLLPIFQTLDATAGEVQAVITAPSRELATQIYQAAEAFTQRDVVITLANFVGGTDKARQLKKLAHTQPQIVVGTPGRILDLIEAQALDVHTARTFVVDEADMTLDMGFLTDVDKIAGHLGTRVQTLVFSATIPQKLQPFLKKYLHNPVIERVKAEAVISDTIDNWLLSSKGGSRNQLILQLCQLTNPYLAMIFANTKTRVDEIHSFLSDNGLKAAKLHGDIPPRERKRVMAGLKRLDYQYVVATDLAARGIDIEGVSHVINDELPRDLSFYIHRVGRTGRNGLTGTAITLYSPADDSAIRELEKLGISFTPKALKNGIIVDSHDRDRRDKREKATPELSNTTRGALAKAKARKHVKPGYKRAIRWQIEEENKKNRRAARNKKSRQTRDARRSSNRNK